MNPTAQQELELSAAETIAQFSSEAVRLTEVDENQQEDATNASNASFSYRCDHPGCTYGSEKASQLKCHRNQIHSKEAIIKGRIVKRNEDGFFTCPGCLIPFKTVANFKKSHSDCLDELPSNDPDNAEDRKEFERFLSDNNVVESIEGNCLVCKEHARIIGKFH